MRTNRTTTIASLNSLVSGLKENQPKGLFLIAGGRYTAAQLAKILQSIVTSMQAIPIAKGAHQKAIRSSRALLLQHHDVVVQLKQSLQMQAHDDTERLASYGLVPRKPTGGASPATLVAAADKAKADAGGTAHHGVEAEAEDHGGQRGRCSGAGRDARRDGEPRRGWGGECHVAEIESARLARSRGDLGLSGARSRRATRSGSCARGL